MDYHTCYTTRACTVRGCYNLQGTVLTIHPGMKTPGVSQLTMNSAEVQSSTNHAHLTAWGIFLQSREQLLATGGPLLSCPSLSLPHIVEICLLLQRVVKLHTNIYRIHSPLLAALKKSTTAFAALMSPAWYRGVKIGTGAHSVLKTLSHHPANNSGLHCQRPVSYLFPALTSCCHWVVSGLSCRAVKESDFLYGIDCGGSLFTEDARQPQERGEKWSKVRN